jgi:hypothetical protein
VGDVDQDTVAYHRIDDRSAELRQALLRPREGKVIDRRSAAAGVLVANRRHTRWATMM